MNVELLEKILMTDTPSVAIKENEKYVFSIIPKLKICKGFNQNSPWHIYDVYDHILKVVDLVPADKIARFAALFHDIGKPEVYRADEDGIGHFWGHWDKSVEIFKVFSLEYNLNADFANAVSKLIFYHDINFGKLNDEELDEICKVLTAEEIKMLFKIKRADLLAQNSKYHSLLNDYDFQEKCTLQRKYMLKQLGE